ncbi:uncharacterized protein LOC103382527 [Cynoglossus semilaevis]|uniref:uncharacterized protein LOC103382527 n=1 Tax=Cynoglossus semilaevis TaxID=244447 RepID=UPI00049503C4|nr:uncharacterized protein LOC103382527 [Cynoglossus semilaevis]
MKLKRLVTKGLTIAARPCTLTLWSSRRTVLVETGELRQLITSVVDWCSTAMPSNVEIKARVSDFSQFAEKAAVLSQSESVHIRQHDTFFNCINGRLKLRDFMNGSGQLIFYERPDTDGPKLSNYSISPTNDPQSLKKVLSDALGVKGEVRKDRQLFMIGQTRVHLDTVGGLGHFMELEGQTHTHTHNVLLVAEDLMHQLDVSQDSLVTGAYMDLILKKQTES